MAEPGEDYLGIYKFKSEAARLAAGQEFGYSTAFVDPAVVDAHKNLIANPTNPGSNGQWLDAVAKFDVTGYLKKNKAIYSSFSESGLHKYLFIKNVACKNASTAISDPALIANYLISITGLKGVVFPDDPLYNALDKGMISDAEYCALLQKHKDVLEKGKQRLLQNAMEGKMPPIGTRIVLFKDSVKVDETIMDGSRQGVRLKTTNKHTFRDGYSLHMFLELKPGEGTAKIQFINQGEGISGVPFFGPINNMVASFMWMASGIAGALRYDLYKQKKPKTEQEVQEFIEDVDGKFHEAVLSTAEPGFLAAKVLCSMMGETMGPLNMRLVTLYTHQQDLAKTRADGMLKLAKNWDALTNLTAKQQINIDDAFMDQHKLAGMAQKGEFLRMLQLAMIKRENIEQLPQGQENAPGGLYNSDGQRYFGPLDDQPWETDPGDWGEQLEKELQSVVKEAILTKLTNESIINLRDKLNEKVDFYLLDKTASPHLLDIQNSVGLNRLVGAYLNPILVASSPGILDKIHKYATLNGLSQKDLDLKVFREQVTVRVLRIYTQEICSVFVDRGGLLDVWTVTKVETTFWGPEKRKILLDAQNLAIEQKEDTETKLEAAKKKYQDAQEAQKQVLKDEVEKTKKELEECEKETKSYEEKLKLNKSITKEMKPEEKYKEHESSLREKLVHH